MKTLPQSNNQLELTLPFWTDNVRALPKAALYSALFAPVMRGARAYMNRVEVASISDYKIIFTGQRLDQGDLDIFQWLIHQVRFKVANTRTDFRQAEILKGTGRLDGTKNRQWLLSSLSRIQACALEIEHNGIAYSGSLLHEFARDDSKGTYYAILNPRLAELFDRDFGGYAQVHFQQRQALKGKELAKWLHGFITGSTRPLTFSLEKLAMLANSGYGRLRDFRNALDEAAEYVRQAGCAVNLAWNASGDKVTISVMKDATAVQR
jgi:TrfA protein